MKNWVKGKHSDEDHTVDISEKYVRMCMASKQIQHLWSFENGDYVFDPAYEEVQVLLYYPAKDISEIIWLPRQDQLQAICIDFFIQNVKK